jgi:hypothetical protein
LRLRRDAPARKTIFPAREVIFRFGDRPVGIALTPSRTGKKNVFAGEKDHFSKRVTCIDCRHHHESRRIVFSRTFFVDLVNSALGRRRHLHYAMRAAQLPAAATMKLSAEGDTAHASLKSQRFRDAE